MLCVLWAMSAALLGGGGGYPVGVSISSATLFFSGLPDNALVPDYRYINRFIHIYNIYIRAYIQSMFPKRCTLSLQGYLTTRWFPTIDT